MRQLSLGLSRGADGRVVGQFARLCSQCFREKVGMDAFPGEAAAVRRRRG